MQIKKYLNKLVSKNPISIYIAENIIRYHKWQRNPPGHYYSPITSRTEFLNKKASLYNFNVEIPGIDLNLTSQLATFEDVKNFFASNNLPSGNRFNSDNKYFFNGDAMMLFYFLKTRKPKKVVEVGSGHSSALMLDLNETLPDQEKINLTFIEPYPKRLNSLLSQDDRKNTIIIESPVQTVDWSVFNSLGAGDILFIDSSHVSKVDSDVNHLLFNILPILKTGVIIHFHDIFYNFEYPEKWILEGRNWNEDYLIRSFLQYNNAFRILFFNSYILQYCKNEIDQKLPSFNSDTIGSLWLEKI